MNATPKVTEKMVTRSASFTNFNLGKSGAKTYALGFAIGYVF